jgi:hypothetical protein
MERTPSRGGGIRSLLSEARQAVNSPDFVVKANDYYTPKQKQTPHADSAKRALTAQPLTPLTLDRSLFGEQRFEPSLSTSTTSLSVYALPWQEHHNYLRGKETNAIPLAACVMLLSAGDMPWVRTGKSAQKRNAKELAVVSVRMTHKVTLPQANPVVATEAQKENVRPAASVSRIYAASPLMSPKRRKSTLGLFPPTPTGAPAQPLFEEPPPPEMEYHLDVFIPRTGIVWTSLVPSVDSLAGLEWGVARCAATVGVATLRPNAALDPSELMLSLPLALWLKQPFAAAEGTSLFSLFEAIQSHELKANSPLAVGIRPSKRETRAECILDGNAANTHFLRELSVALSALVDLPASAEEDTAAASQDLGTALAKLVTAVPVLGPLGKVRILLLPRLPAATEAKTASKAAKTAGQLRSRVASSRAAAAEESATAELCRAVPRPSFVRQSFGLANLQAVKSPASMLHLLTLPSDVGRLGVWRWLRSVGETVVLHADDADAVLLASARWRKWQKRVLESGMDEDAGRLHVAASMMQRKWRSMRRVATMQSLVAAVRSPHRRDQETADMARRRAQAQKNLCKLWVAAQLVARLKRSRAKLADQKQYENRLSAAKALYAQLSMSPPTAKGGAGSAASMLTAGVAAGDESLWDTLATRTLRVEEGSVAEVCVATVFVCSLPYLWQPSTGKAFALFPGSTFRAPSGVVTLSVAQTKGFDATEPLSAEGWALYEPYFVVRVNLLGTASSQIDSMLSYSQVRQCIVERDFSVGKRFGGAQLKDFLRFGMDVYDKRYGNFYEHWENAYEEMLRVSAGDDALRHDTSASSRSPDLVAPGNVLDLDLGGSDEKLIAREVWDSIPEMLQVDESDRCSVLDETDLARLDDVAPAPAMDSCFPLLRSPWKSKTPRKPLPSAILLCGCPRVDDALMLSDPSSCVHHPSLCTCGFATTFRSIRVVRGKSVLLLLDQADSAATPWRISAFVHTTEDLRLVSSRLLTGADHISEQQSSRMLREAASVTAISSWLSEE